MSPSILFWTLKFHWSFVFKMSLGQQKSVFLILKPYKTSLKLLRKNRIIYIIYGIINLSNRTNYLPWKFCIFCIFPSHPIRRPVRLKLDQVQDNCYILQVSCDQTWKSIINTANSDVRYGKNVREVVYSNLHETIWLL